MKIGRKTVEASILAATVFLLGASSGAAAGSEGALTQKSGADACIVEDNNIAGVTSCADGVALNDNRGVTVSPNGKSAYVASYGSSGVAVFDRNTTTGVLTQKSGTDACISEDGSSGDCTDGAGLNLASSVAVSPDGKSAYVASLGGVAVFDRNTTTGVLTQKSGTDACISETGAGGECTDGVALSGPSAVTISPDGESAYVASNFSDAVAVFDRNTTTGVLTQKSGTDACISEDGSSGDLHRRRRSQRPLRGHHLP